MMELVNIFMVVVLCVCDYGCVGIRGWGEIG